MSEQHVEERAWEPLGVRCTVRARLGGESLEKIEHTVAVTVNFCRGSHWDPGLGAQPLQKFAGLGAWKAPKNAFGSHAAS
jgi:hypothetical protein